MNVNFEYYRIFYYVAKYGNFTRAAQALGSNQPNVTRAMNRLEGETGCLLLIRTNRGIRLTPEGEQLYLHVRAAMEQLLLAEKEMASGSSLESGTISIGVSETALNCYLLDRLQRFHEKYPGIRLKISGKSTPDALVSVRDGEIDFAVVTSPLRVESPLVEVSLLSFQEILVGGASFQDLSREGLSLSRLPAFPLIGLGSGTVTYDFYQEIFWQNGLFYQPDTQAAASDQLLPLVRSGLGLAFIPEPMVRDAITRKEVFAIPVRETIPERRICLVYDPQHPSGTAARSLLQLLQPACSARI